MPATTKSEHARFFRSPALPETEMLSARYLTHSFAPHWHEGYVIGVITAGAEGYRYRGSQHVAGKGGIACINPDEVHTGERATEEGWAYRVFYPSAHVLRDLACQALGGRDLGLPRLPHNVVEDHELAVALSRAHQLLESGEDVLQAQTVALAALSELLVRHSQWSTSVPRGEGSARGEGESRRVEIMRQRLSADLSEQITLDELAACVGLSPFHAARLFARHVGMPPHAWRNQLRLNRSLVLLRQGGTVTEAAMQCGFADQSHYTRHFRKSFGCTPGRWRS